MVDWIMLELVGGTAILFIALTLDEMAHRTEVRRSLQTSPIQPNEVTNEVATKHMAKDDENRQAA